MSARVPSFVFAHVVPATQLESRDRRGRLSTGIPELDQQIGGGWPRGALSELTGGRTSGRTALLLASLAEALRRQEAVALVDVGGTLDPRAAQRTGVSLSRLLWVRCEPEKGLAAADIVLGAGGFGLVALDLGEEKMHVPMVSWVRLKRGPQRQGTVMLVASSRRGQGVSGACAVTLRRVQPRFHGERRPGASPLLIGLESCATLERGVGGEAVASSARVRFSHLPK